MSGNRHLIEQWLGAGAETARHEQNVRQDRYDRTIFGEIRDSSERVRRLEDQAPETFPALLQDFWAGFYKADPELEEEGRLNLAHKVNRSFVERLLDDSATREARITTMLDELSSAVAATEAGSRMLEEINERDDLKQAMQKAQEAAEQDAAGNEQGAQDASAAAEQLLQGAARDVRRAVRESIKAGQEKAEEVQQVLAGWGLEPGDLQHMPIGDRLKLAEALTCDGKMKRIADLVGRMRNLARARQRQKTKQRRDEIHSITVGNELQHVLPQELGALAHPVRKLDFYRRFTEGQLLQYDLKSEERLARGPIVAAIDVSGSMSGAPLEWAIASALALADTASRQKRFCHIMFFNSAVKVEFSFEPGERSADKYAQMAQIGVAGGTDYQPALERAGAIMAEQKEYENADIVMVTDGLCKLQDEFLEYFTGWKDAHKVNCYLVMIGHDPMDGLEQWTDKMWRITDLADAGDEIAGELFEEVY